MGTPADGTNGRRVELDSLRALAALAVVAYHYTWLSPQDGLTRATRLQVPWGHYGVGLFFVISGVVIGASASRHHRARTFATGRASRILPAYVVAVVVSAVVASVTQRPGWDLGLVDVAVNLTMLQRFVGVPNVDPVYWTLSLELLFYAFVAALLRFGWWRRPARDVALLVWMEAAVVWALLPYERQPSWQAGPWSPFLFYGPLFVGGIVVAEGWGPTSRTRALTVCTVVVAALAEVLAADRHEMAVSVASVAVVSVALHAPPAVLRLRPLVVVGQASYVIYLFHEVPGTALLARWTALPADLAALAVAATVCGVAVPLHRFVEVPATRWLRRRLTR